MVSKEPLSDRIAAYNEELRRYYRRGHATAPAVAHPTAAVEASVTPAASDETAAAASTVRETMPTEASEIPLEQPWAAAQPPETSFTPPSDAPSFGAEPTEQGADVEQETVPMAPLPDESDTGNLLVRVFSARGAIPLAGATVRIGHEQNGSETLLHVTTTDESGNTPLFSLPTVDRSLSQRPGAAQTGSFYTVHTSLPGYYSVRNERVPVYGGVTSVQQIAMIPLPDPEIDGEMIFRESSRPTDLG